MNWYLAKIKYQLEQENGSLKTINESYLLKAVSYTDAEKRVFDIVADSTPDFTIASLTKRNYTDVFQDYGGESWYHIKAHYVSIDDSKGAPKEKKVNCPMLISADTPKQAIERIEKYTQNWLIPLVITGATQTQILEVHDLN